MIKQNYKKVVSILVLSCFFVSCAGMNLNPAALEGNHARGNFVNRTFLMALADYNYYANLENLTDEAKTLLRAKREILVQFIDPLYGPVTLFNRAVVGGELITDEAWNSMLDRLLQLETGWYVGKTQTETVGMYTGGATPQTFKLDEKATNQIILQNAQAAAIIEKGYKKQALWEGLLLELIRTGIHCLRAMISQRGKSPEELQMMWTESWAQVQAINVADIPVIQ